MSKPLVSIVLPIYNVESFLERCLVSIEHQTYTDLQVIMVNDGSLDSSREIALKFQERDQRFLLVDRINGGLSAARNTGLKYVEGDYVIFVDSDDWAELTFVEKMVDNIISSHSDMSCCRLRYVNIETKAEVIYGKKYRNSIMEGDSIIFDAFVVKNIHTPVWAKIYDTRFLRRFKLNFYEGIVNEDTLFTLQVALYATRVSFVDEVLFNSLERANSISRSQQGRLFRDMDTALLEVRKVMEYRGLWQQELFKKIYYARYVKSMLYNLLQAAQRLGRNEFMDVYKFCMEHTSYKRYISKSSCLPLPHKVMSRLSLDVDLFLTSFKIMSFFGFRMH